MDYYARQAFNERNVPGRSIADNQFMDRWESKARADDVHRVTVQNRQTLARDKAKAAEALARINTLQDDFVTVRKQAERNEVPWDEIAKTQRKLVRERLKLENLLESLNATHAKREAMAADPIGYLEAFYSRYPTLNDRRPNLAVDLAEDQRKRGVANLL